MELVSPEDVAKYNEKYIQEEVKNLTQIIHDGIPDELKDLSYWLIWEPSPNALCYTATEAFSEDNPPKILKKPIGAQWTDPANQKSYGEVNRTINKMEYRDLAIGFGFHDEHPYICIDIDDASPMNQKLMKAFKSYTEWSPSGKGAHIWIKVDDKKAVIDAIGKGKRNKSAERDLFISSGYCTVTGKVIASMSGLEIVEYKAQDAINLLSPYFLSTITSIDTDLTKSEKKAHKKLHDKTHKQVKIPVNKIVEYLELCPVQTLTSDIFDRMNLSKPAKLNLNETEEARGPWLIIGQALHNHFEGSTQGCLIWDEWSRKGRKYDEAALNAAWKSFDDTKDTKITLASLVKLAQAQKLQFPDTNAKGLPLGTPTNFMTYFNYVGYKIKLNVITNQIQITPPKEKLYVWGISSVDYIDSISVASAYLNGDIQLYGLSPSTFNTVIIRKILTQQVSLPENRYHPIKEYFSELQWDGESRLDELMQTMELAPGSSLDKYNSYKLFLRKWLIQVVAAAHASEYNQYMLNLMIILMGEQNIGKTKWVKSLFPSKLRTYCAADKEVKMSAFRSDSVKLTMELTSTLICNINEVDRSFDPKFFADFKAFLDRTTEQIVLPYGDAPVLKSRQTCFIGSTNKRNFLHDTTGNRRFFIFDVKNLNFNHSVDIDQLWAEITYYYHKGEKWWINPDTTTEVEKMALAVQKMQNNISMHLGSEDLIDTLSEVFDYERPGDEWKRMPFASIRRLLGLNELRVNGREFNVIKYTLETWLKTIPNYVEPELGIGQRARKYYYMPPLRTTTEEEEF